MKRNEHASPKISVIIPVYGVEEYIERCVRSLFEQTIDDIEYLFDSVMHVVQRNNHKQGNTRVLFYDNPTQAIAQGLRIDRRPIEETFDCFYGLDENNNVPVRLCKVNSIRDEMYHTFRHFLDDLGSADIRNVLVGDLNIHLNIVITDAILNMGSDSINMCIDENMQVYSPDARCDKALFFWSLKHSLYGWLKRNC